MSRSRRHLRSGQSLVEFAVVALVMYMLLAAILTFGHALYVAQGLQGAADLAAREISRTPLGVNIESLDEDDVLGSGAMNEKDVRLGIYDNAYLVIDLDVFYEANPSGNIFRDIVPSLPLVNQQLVTMMIVDRPVVDNTQRWFLRYPGALLKRNDAVVHPNSSDGDNYDSWVASDLMVGVPLIAPDGSIEWLGVVEEIESDSNENPFSVVNVKTNGIVALRINYPFQSASMSSFRPNAAGPFEPTIGQPNAADDGSVVELNDPPGALTGASLESGGLYAGTYGGKYGLGAQGALGQTVRPYRRVISAQAIYRREVFE